MVNRAPSRRKAVNLSIDAELLAEARAAGANLSRILETALSDQLRDTRKRKWQAENHDATQSMEDYIRMHGLWSDRYRTW